MNTLQWWIVAWAIAALALIYGIMWGRTGCPRWFLSCTCQNLPGPDLSMPAPGAGEFHDQWEDLEPEAAADQLIAEWHAPDLALTAEDWIARDLADLELLAWDARVQAARCWEILHVEFPRLRTELCAA